jgi:YbbR domain-containing protein
MALRDIVTRDLGWKILSVALAVAIWLSVHAISEDASQHINPLNGLRTRTFQDVPVLVVSTAADVREFKVNPGAVQITISGKPDAVIALEARHIRVLVDLTGVEAALALRKRVEVSTPPGITFVSAVPAEVDVVAPPRRRN